MSILHLVRHGQASFGADDYDNLSPKGVQQSIELGKALTKQQSTFDHVIVGPHRRHIQTFEGIKEGYNLWFYFYKIYISIFRLNKVI